jgi:hypothetical protein
MLTKSDGTLIMTVRVTLKPGRDDDLIVMLQSAPPRGLAAVVREAMRSGVMDQPPTGDDGAALPDLGEDI